jgi:anti-sigma factor RsiW
MTDPKAPVGEDDDLQAYVDGRVAAHQLASVEAHLAEHPERKALLQQQRLHVDAMRRALRAKHDEPIPERLRVGNIRAGRRRRLGSRIRVGAIAASMLFVGFAGGWLASQRWSEVAPNASLASAAMVSGEALAAYRTFVVEVVHPVEVGVDKEQHLMAWLSKRLGRRLAAPDLSGFGFKLMGGRLLPNATGAAAQLMYEAKDGERLTLYIKAAEGSETAFRFFENGDTTTLAWLDQGYGFAVTAGLPRTALLPIAEAVYRDLDTAPPAARQQPG